MAQNAYQPYGYGSEPYYSGSVVAPSRSYEHSRSGSQASAKHLESSMQQSMLDGPVARARSFDGSFSFPRFESSFHHGDVNFDPSPHALLEGQRSYTPRDTGVGYTNPIANFYNDTDAPWSSVRAINNQANSSVAAASLTVPAANLDFITYREAPPSELSDSGYASQAAATQSITSTEPTDYNRECGDLPLQVGGFTLGVGPSNSPTFDTSHFSQQAEEPSTRRPLQQQRKLVCPRCFEEAKCPSDLKKHMLKHEKPWRCGHPGCTRKDGFTTVNDLERHKKSVHKIGGMTKSFKCVAERCKTKDKVWPRLDNFKQHVQRMHHDEDLEDLIRRSQYHEQPTNPSTPRAQPISPIENSLAGIDGKSNVPDIAKQDSPDFGLTRDADDDGAKTTVHQNAFVSDQKSSSQVAQQQRPSSRNDTKHPIIVPGQLMHNQVSASSSSGISKLKELADAATANPTPVDTSSSNYSAKNGLSTTRSKTNPQSEESQEKFLNHFSHAIVSHINNGGPNEPLDRAVLRALMDLDKVENFIVPRASQPKLEHTGDKSFKGGISSQSFEGPDGTEGIITTAEVLQGLAALSKRIRKSAKKPHVASNSKAGKAPGVKCRICDKTLPRNCDLNKHMKRHTKPYGCTFPKCQKTFGSKNDWKRHENSQHFQLEMWRCEQPCSTSDAGANSTKCALLFYHKPVFQQHLVERHKLDEEGVQHELKERRIGRNGQSRFWCGFCKAIVPLQNRGVPAWDERFDHIDKHFKEHAKIADWWDIEANKPKGEAYTRMEKTDFGDEDPDPRAEYRSLAGGDSSSDSDEHNEPGEPGLRSTSPDSASVGVAVTIASKDNMGRRKRRLEDSDTIERPRKSSRCEILFYCCGCQEGPFAWSLYKNCITCDHSFCGRCDRKRLDPSTAAGDEIDFDVFAAGRGL